MTGSTKILTVSYGTFSCTLEGFDDPFGTMRGIAEYFRDLAADDRYFGAEPPTPDVEMLQRIAEKEVQRRVEARLADSGIALTQVTDARDDTPETETPEAEVSTPAPEAARPAPEQKMRDAAAPDYDHGPLAPDDDYLLSDEPEDVLAVDPDARVVADGPAESVAEKLRRIRAVVSRSIEPEADENDRSFSGPQALLAGDDDAEAPKKHALTETIRQITEDLSDEDLAAEGEDEDEDEPETIGDAATNFFEDQGDEEEPESADRDDGWDFDTEGLTASAKPEEGSDTGEDLDPDDASDDALISKIIGRDAHGTPDAHQKAPAPQGSGDEQRRVARPLTPLSEEGGDVGRLLAETDNHLKDDESIRRRRVISQMRAAVAATKAERLVSRRVLTPEEEVAAEQERYRDDLNEVVREVSRPLPAKENDRRPSVAPLVLVSSQRVDRTASPARVQKEEETTDTGDFVGFAKDMGARELPELLEAAAAYASFVEGQPSFTRPEIMRRVARVDPTLKLSREEGLRSFGQLLRQGTFRKLERGQFTIVDTSRFKPDRRIAGE